MQTQDNHSRDNHAKIILSTGIYDLSGRLVENLVNDQLPVGNHSRTWAAVGYSSRMYFVKMEAEELSQIMEVI